MNAITIRNLSDEAARALEARAAENGTTAEVEAERILQEVLAVVPQEVTADTGETLVAAFQRLRKDFPELEEVEFTRDQSLPRAPTFE